MGDHRWKCTRRTYHRRAQLGATAVRARGCRDPNPRTPLGGCSRALSGGTRSSTSLRSSLFSFSNSGPKNWTKRRPKRSLRLLVGRRHGWPLIRQDPSETRCDRPSNEVVDRTDRSSESAPTLRRGRVPGVCQGHAFENWHRLNEARVPANRPISER
jgi:hypothetical protein